MKRLYLLFLLAMAVSCGEKDKKVEQKVVEQKTEPTVKNERPVMTFTLVDGTSVDAQTLTRKMVLVLFQPDCDHCQAEAKQIRNRLDAFRDYDLYFISSHPSEVVQGFARDYDLDKKPNVFFGSTSVESVLDNFGAISAPSVYIYNEQGKLVEEFEGQVDVEMIIRHL